MHCAACLTFPLLLLTCGGLLACGGSTSNDGDAAVGGAGGSVGGAGSGGASGGTGGGAGGLSGAAGTGGGIATCPDGLPGPEMVAIDTPGGWFCIDSLETSDLEYLVFLKTNPSVENQPAYCAFNTAFGPEPPPDQYPAITNWCQADAYCNWAGKRLCGRIGGGPVDYDAYADTKQDEWFFACSRGGKQVYPYGNTFDDSACATADNPYVSGVRKVNKVGNCEGGFVGIGNMSGNVAEWENSCSEWSGQNDGCHQRGGSYQSIEEGVRCTFDDFQYRANGAGIRCCADAVLAQ
jgi:Sulfatase-modifying factor enzyme 1